MVNYHAPSSIPTFLIPPANALQACTHTSSTHVQFSLYYHIPSLSVKGCCYELLANNVTPGFDMSVMRSGKTIETKNVSVVCVCACSVGCCFIIVESVLVLYVLDQCVGSVLDCWISVGSVRVLLLDAAVEVQKLLG